MDFKLSVLDSHGRLQVEVEFPSFAVADEHMKRGCSIGDPLARGLVLILRREVWPTDGGMLVGDIWTWNFAKEVFERLF